MPPAEAKMGRSAAYMPAFRLVSKGAGFGLLSEQADKICHPIARHPMLAGEKPAIAESILPPDNDS